MPDDLRPLPSDCAKRRADGGCAVCRARPFSVCASVPDTDLHRLEALAERVTLQAGETLVRQGDPVARVFNVTSGALRVYRLTADGRRQITGFLFAGDFVGLSGGDTQEAFVEAMEPSGLCAFRHSAYRELMAERRELEKALLARAGDELSAAQRHIVVLGRKTAVERLATFLLDLPGENPMETGPADEVRLAMTRGEIADYLGLTLKTVSRSFSRLKRLGLIRQLSLSRLQVIDRQRLRALAEGEA